MNNFLKREKKKNQGVVGRERKIVCIGINWIKS
jgi:hypothetical protein